MYREVIEEVELNPPQEHMLEEHQARTAMSISDYVYGVAFHSEGSQPVEQGTQRGPTVSVTSGSP